jgi:hypothetical protein
MAQTGSPLPPSSKALALLLLMTACSGGAAKPRDAGPEVPAEATLVPPADISFPEAPAMSCAVATDCPFPPSACADPSCDGGICPGEQWVIYYDSPSCVTGQCTYTKKYFQCQYSDVCTAGGCHFNGTAAHGGQIESRLCGA